VAQRGTIMSLTEEGISGACTSRLAPQRLNLAACGFMTHCFIVFLQRFGRASQRKSHQGFPRSTPTGKRKNCRPQNLRDHDDPHQRHPDSLFSNVSLLSLVRSDGGGSFRGCPRTNSDRAGSQVTEQLAGVGIEDAQVKHGHILGNGVLHGGG